MNLIQDLGKVVVGSGASITSDTYPGRVFRGRVSYIDPTLDQATRTAQARIELANPGQALKIGMFVNVAFAALGESQSTTLVIPRSAVQNINDQQVVFVETAKANTYAMRPVKLGSEFNGQQPVLEGLTVGERIVTDGSFLLRAEWLKRNPAVHSHQPKKESTERERTKLLLAMSPLDQNSDLNPSPVTLRTSPSYGGNMRYLRASLIALAFCAVSAGFGYAHFRVANATDISAGHQTPAAMSCQRCGDGVCARSCENERTCPRDCLGTPSAR